MVVNARGKPVHNCAFCTRPSCLQPPLVRCLPLQLVATASSSQHLGDFNCNQWHSDRTTSYLATVVSRLVRSMLRRVSLCVVRLAECIPCMALSLARRYANREHESSGWGTRFQIGTRLGCLKCQKFWNIIIRLLGPGCSNSSKAETMPDQNVLGKSAHRSEVEVWLHRLQQPNHVRCRRSGEAAGTQCTVRPCTQRTLPDGTPLWGTGSRVVTQRLWDTKARGFNPFGSKLLTFRSEVSGFWYPSDPGSVNFF